MFTSLIVIYLRKTTMTLNDHKMKIVKLRISLNINK